jgi:hypothetical protein
MATLQCYGVGHGRAAGLAAASKVVSCVVTVQVNPFHFVAFRILEPLLEWHGWRQPLCDRETRFVHGAGGVVHHVPRGYLGNPNHHQVKPSGKLLYHCHGISAFSST